MGQSKKQFNELREQEINEMEATLVDDIDTSSYAQFFFNPLDLYSNTNLVKELQELNNQLKNKK